MARHIGGSLLPSNCPLILLPMQTPIGVLQVRVLEEDDTHGLFDVASGDLLAEHSNGYSCHVLAERMRDNRRAAEQARYIVACGGAITEAGKAAVKRATGEEV